MSRLFPLWMRCCFECWMTCVWPDCQWLSTKERMIVRKEKEQRTARVTACASGSRIYQGCALSLYAVTTFVIVTVTTGSSLATEHNDLVQRRPVKGLFPQASHVITRWSCRWSVLDVSVENITAALHSWTPSCDECLSGGKQPHHYLDLLFSPSVSPPSPSLSLSLFTPLFWFPVCCCHVPPPSFLSHHWCPRFFGSRQWWMFVRGPSSWRVSASTILLSLWCLLFLHQLGSVLFSCSAPLL